MAKIQYIPKVGKVKEKFLAKDCGIFSESELFDILIRRGIKAKDAKKFSEQIIEKYNNKNFKYLQGENKQNFYGCDGIQFSILDLLIDKKIKCKENENNKTKKIKILDLFAGIGGIKIGFEKAGFECIFSNDFDRDCKITYDLNFSKNQKSLVLGDISKISSDIIPDFDVLTGGFPCQPFSIAGYRKGFDDGGRGNLFFEI
ncbi:MAG: DNA (cytosine-5-)-methyltransferase [bacterium]